MKLYLLILGYSLFSLYLPACENCLEDMENTMYMIESRKDYVYVDDKWNEFFAGEVNGLKIACEIYRLNHQD